MEKGIPWYVVGNKTSLPEGHTKARLVRQSFPLRMRHGLFTNKATRALINRLTDTVRGDSEFIFLKKSEEIMSIWIWFNAK